MANAADTHTQAARSGFEARQSAIDHPHDAATPQRGTKFTKIVPEEDSGSNPEGIGFADQVGGASASVGTFHRREKLERLGAKKVDE